MGLSKRAIACVLAAVLGLSGVFVPGVAWAEEEPEVPEWAIDDGDAQDSLFAQATLPTTYDMRSEGLVTPVKFQNPWGSCWAFGGTAAAETSILSAYGSTYEQSKLDLSERHLTYFALQPVSEAVNPNQVGEGLHTTDWLNDSLGANAAFDAGGQPVFITTLFAQGIGPMLESQYPYRGNNAITSMDDYNKDPKKATKALLAAELGSAKAVEDYIKAKAVDGKTYDQALKELIAVVKTILETSPTYSKNDDWSIPETNADGSPNRLVSNGMVLRNGNVLPTYWVDDALNQMSVDAIKQEILNGRAVSINFYCDQGSTYSKTPTEESKDRAQYVYDKLQMNHGVCIVGWDDNYSRDHFTHEATTVGQDGQPIIRTPETTPPGDGAWIVKNSYGSETEWMTDDLGNTINKSKWGNLNENGEATGYFYLSYYDKTIQQAESMEFDANLGADGAFAVLQHDYMPSYGGFYTTPATSGNNVTSSANVFEASGQAIALKCVSTRTSETNARVTFAIYELNDGAKNPTDGKLLYRTSRNFEYGGFHRLDIDHPTTIAAGKKFSIVSTMSTVSQEGTRCYSAVASQGVSEKYVEKVTDGKGKFYASAVVNPGESYLYTDGTWVDWKEYTNGLLLDEAYLPNVTKHIEALPIDNFSIKAYGIPVEEPEPEPEPGAIALSGSGHVQTYGDMSAKASGKGILIGTTGEAKRLERFSVSLPKDANGGVEYRAHLQGKGWGDWAQGGKPCGTSGEARRMEAVQMRLTGKLADTHSIWYRTHSQTWGWLGWACDGQAAGTAGQAKRGEAIEVQVLPKGEVPEGYAEKQASYVGAATADVHLQRAGWTGAKSALEFGTTGQARRLEAIRLSVPNQPVAGGISYEAHVQGKGWMPAAANGALAGTSGQAKRLEAVKISLTGDMAKENGYSVWYRAHSQTYGWLGWAHDGEPAGTTGLAKRAEAIDVQVLPQGQVPRGYDASKAACVSA